MEAWSGMHRPAVPGALGYMFGWLARPGVPDSWFVLGTGDMAALKLCEGVQSSGCRGWGGRQGRERRGLSA